MATNLNVTELDFEDIKSNLKNFLKKQTVFNDYDFDGAGLNVLLDVLAYNTHYNAMAAHLALNEAFLDSAQIRGNAVSRARMLGYVPASQLAPKATINIVVDVTNETGTKPANLTLSRGTKLTTTLDGETFQFVTLSTQTAKLTGDAYTYNNVEIAEGTFNSIKYRIDNDISNQKFQISHKNVDTSTLRTRVQANEESTSFDIYTLFTTLLNVDSTTKTYHLQENSNGFYEIYFGDGVTGAKPTNNNIVTLDYVFSSGVEANGAKTFTLNDTLGGFSGITITTINNASGGADQETLESIRFNAPITFTSQNRAVTSDDYRAIIQREFSNISAISTWGVFQPTPDEPDSVILLDCQRGRWDFPELKRIAYEEYKYWDPDMTIIESKASGTPLTHELRRLGIPVVNYSPTRGHDKSTRMHSVAPIFESGLVWAPERKFADEMIEECAAFPFGKNDDLCDTMTQALMRFREGGLVSLNDDYLEDARPPVKRAYY